MVYGSISFFHTKLYFPMPFNKKSFISLLTWLATSPSPTLSTFCFVPFSVCVQVPHFTDCGCPSVISYLVDGLSPGSCLLFLHVCFSCEF